MAVGPVLKSVVYVAANVLDSLTAPVKLLMGQRSLLQLLMRRDMLTRTSGTLLGGLWLIAQPALQILGLWFFLDIVIKVRSTSHVPFMEYFLIGMLAWMMISEILSRNLMVMQEFSTLYQRTVFPLPLLPLLPLAVSTVTYGIVLVVVSILLHGPLAGLKALLAVFALSIWLIPFSNLIAVLGLFIKELRQVVPFSLTLLMYLTPIMYMPDLLPKTIQPWMVLNPIADVMALLHALIQGTDWTVGNVLRPLLLWAFLLPSAWLLFRRTEPHMREAL